MRGKVQPERDVQDAARITPAYAGKRHHPEPGQSSSEDHPRVCGEKSAHPSQQLLWKGSPPRMRGKAGRKSSRGRMGGITPAYAGKSSMKTQAVQPTGDHPRVCGEKSSTGIQMQERIGSPPCVRGKVDALSDIIQDYGITPACAGKSPQRAHCSPVPWDHPCVCGEKIEMPYELLLKEGSPPRVRGKAKKATLCAMRGGITPAYAGKRPCS